jgi:dephospho-CoA kinase
MLPRIIGLTGYKGSGKDEAARFLRYFGYLRRLDQEHP